MLLSWNAQRELTALASRGQLVNGIHAVFKACDGNWEGVVCSLSVRKCRCAGGRTLCGRWCVVRAQMVYGIIHGWREDTEVRAEPAGRLRTAERAWVRQTMNMTNCCGWIACSLASRGIEGKE